jgi:LysR family hydrogen peroxide-inducible transcriptional activator
MEIHQLRYFCAVAREGTFTRASEVEHVAQPSLSQQILKLEAELGARLFDRLPRSAKLTVFGKALLPKAKRILRELEEAKTEILEMSGNEKGEVVVGIIPTIAAYLLPQLLDGLATRHPLITVKIYEDITPVLLQRLHDGTVDIAIAALPISGIELVNEELFEEKFYAVLPEKHRSASRANISLTEGGPLLSRQPDRSLSKIQDVSQCRLRKRSIRDGTRHGIGRNGRICGASHGRAATPGMQVHPDLRQA